MLVRISATFFALAAAFIAMPSYADSGYGWIKKTTDKGCYLYHQDIIYGEEDADPKTADGFVWSAPCTPGQPINGEGTLYNQFSFRLIRSYRGRVVNGYLDGRVQIRDHPVADDGSWDPEGGVLNPTGLSEEVYERGCTSISYCKPGQAEDPLIVPRISPPRFPLPTAASARSTASQTFGIGVPPSAQSQTGAQGAVARRVETPLNAGGALPGSTNLECVVFVPGEGPDARSSLVNRCGEEVRLNYCLQYLNGADNCSPMSIGQEATLWPLRAGASLTMPAADTLKLWSVFACRAPTYPMNAIFRNGMLTDGSCPEDDLAPPPGETRKIVRSDDPTTWPPGFANVQCLNFEPQLGRNLDVRVRNDCGSAQNIYLCVVSNGSQMTHPTCFDRPIVDSSATFPVAPSFNKSVAKPNTYQSVHAFACDAPLQPFDLRWDGKKLTGTCKAP